MAGLLGDDEEQRKQSLGLLGLLMGGGILAGNQPGASMGQALGQGMNQGVTGLMQMQGQKANQDLRALQMQKLKADMAREQGQQSALAALFGGPDGQGINWNTPRPMDDGQRKAMMGQAFPTQVGAAAAESMFPKPTDNWQEIGGGLQRNAKTGETKPISPKLVDLAVNPTMNMPPQPKAESEIVGKGYGQMYVDLQNSAMSTPGKVAKLDKLDSLLGQTYTGFGGEEVQQFYRALKGAGDAFGIDTSAVGTKVGAAESAQAIAKEIALEFRNPAGGAGMPGALSDSDRKFLEQMTGGDLSTTPAGRKQIIDARRALLKREQDVAKLARDYRKKNGQIDEGFFDDLQAYSDKNPLFKDNKTSGTPQPPGNNPYSRMSDQQILEDLRKRGLVE